MGKYTNISERGTHHEHSINKIVNDAVSIEILTLTFKMKLCLITRANLRTYI